MIKFNKSVIEVAGMFFPGSAYLEPILVEQGHIMFHDKLWWLLTNNKSLRGNPDAIEAGLGDKYGYKYSWALGQNGYTKEKQTNAMKSKEQIIGEIIGSLMVNAQLREDCLGFCMDNFSSDIEDVSGGFDDETMEFIKKYGDSRI